VETLLLLLVIYNVINGLVVSWLAGRLIQCSLWQQLYIVGSTPLYFLTNSMKRL
jgi:hypothetical protein